MKSRTQKFTACVALLSMSASSTLAFAEDRSMHDATHVADSIVNYLDQYQKIQSQNIQPLQAGQSAQEWSTQWERSRAHLVLKALMEGNLETLSQQIASLTNDDTQAQKIGYWLRGLVSDVSNLNPQIYDDTISRLLADYYENPQNRDALLELMKGVSSQLKATGATSSNPHRYWEAAANGTMAAWTLLTLWNWRGGKQGLAKDGRKIYDGLGKGVRWISQQLKNKIRLGGGQAPGALVATADWVGATGTQLPQLVRNAQAADRAGDIKKDLAIVLEKDWKETAQNAQDTEKKISKTWLRKLTLFIRDLGASAVVGGGAYSLYEWNLSTASVKLDPLLPLELIQAYSIFNLETKSLALKASLAHKTSAAAVKSFVELYVRSPIQAERYIQGLFFQHQQLKMEYSHLASAAPQFRANIPLPKDNLIPDVYSGSESDRRNVKNFLNQSKRLQAIAERMRTAPASSVSLNPIELHMSDMESLLGGMQAQLQQLKLLQPEDLELIRKSLG